MEPACVRLERLWLQALKAGDTQIDTTISLLQTKQASVTGTASRAGSVPVTIHPTGRDLQQQQPGDLVPAALFNPSTLTTSRGGLHEVGLQEVTGTAAQAAMEDTADPHWHNSEHRASQINPRTVRWLSQWPGMHSRTDDAMRAGATLWPGQL